MPLEVLFLSDANAAKQALETLTGREAFKQLSLRPMPGNNGLRPSAKVYLEVDKDDKQYVTDLGAVSTSDPSVVGRQS